MDFIKQQWKEFTETVLPVTNSQGETKIFNTQQTELFINNETVIYPHIHVSWFNSIPGVLTGLGLLGTFVSLLIGLAHIHVMPDGQVQGIQGLINGLSGKFWSSIFGLLFSICFLVAEKHLIGNIQTKCLRLQHKLNTIFARNFSENILLKVSKSMEEQSASLKNFNADLAGRLKESLNESMGPTLDRMSVAIEKLLNVVEKSEHEKNDSITGAIKDMVQILQQQSENMSKNFSDSLTGAANSEIQRLSSSLANAANFLQGMEEKNNNLNEKMGSMLSNLDSNIRMQQEQSVSQNKAITELTGNLLDQMNSSSSQHFDQLQGTVNDIISKLSNMSETMNEQFTSNNDQLLQKSIEQQDKLQDTLSYMLQKVEANLGTQHDFSVNQNEKLAEAMSNLVKTLESGSMSYVQKIEDTFNNMLNKTSNWADQINDQLLNTINTQADQNKNIQQSVSAIQDSLSAFKDVIQANQDLVRKIENVSNELTKSSSTLGNASNISKQSQEVIAESIRDLLGEMSRYKGSVDSTVALWDRQKQFCETFDSTLGELLTKINNKMIEYSNNTSISLENYLKQFDKHLTDAVQNIGGAVSELSDNLNELGETIEESIRKASVGV